MPTSTSAAIPQTRLNVTLDGVPLQRARGLRSLLRGLRRLRELAGEHPGPARRRHVERGHRLLRGIGQLRERRPRRARPDRETPRRRAPSEPTARTLGAESGPVGPALRLYGRGSYQETDGFRDHSGVDQKSLFYGASRARTTAPSSRCSDSSAASRPSSRSWPRRRTCSSGTCDSTRLLPRRRDRFGQQFVQAQYTRFLGSTSSLAGQVYYNGAGGFYRIWADPEHAALYEYDLDWHFVGGILTFRHVRPSRLHRGRARQRVREPPRPRRRGRRPRST